jgi:hypothetical protein
MKPRRTSPRLLYRAGVTPDELDRLITEIGPARLREALDRWSPPPRPPK